LLPRKAVHGLIHGPLAVGFLGQVAADGHAAMPRLLDQPGGMLRVLVLPIGQVRDGHVGALLGERHGDRPADTRVTAGDQRAFPGQQATALVIPHLIPGTGIHLAGPAGIVLGLLWRRVFLCGHGHLVRLLL
jgi:hypothetical protein